MSTTGGTSDGTHESLPLRSSFEGVPSTSTSVKSTSTSVVPKNKCL